MNKKTTRQSRLKRIWLTVLAFMIVSLFIFVILSRTPAGYVSEDPSDDGSSSASHPVTLLPTAEPGLTYTEMTLLSVGDIMFHTPQLEYARDSVTGEYDFNDNFKYVKDLISSADLAIGNFETTICGTDYRGSYPFRSPLSTLDAIKNAGFDVMLFANNHTFDSGREGVLSTLQHFQEFGLLSVGATKDPATEKSSGIFTINGIKIGVINYTDSITGDNASNHTINGITIPNDFFHYMNIFVRGQEEAFYQRVAEDLQYFEQENVDIIISYLHWGSEYYLQEETHQRILAQKLCNMGVDVIIGSHPHVIQPMDVFVSETNPEHSTLCFFSLGNYISNQNRNAIQWSSEAPGKGYSENGLTVQLTLRRYSDGRTMVSQIDYTPTWVHRFWEDGKLKYNIIPLPVSEEEYEKYGLTKSSYGIAHALESFQRTDSVLKDAVSVFNQQATETIALIEENN